jgi:hypothetical protein
MQIALPEEFPQREKLLELRCAARAAGHMGADGARVGLVIQQTVQEDLCFVAVHLGYLSFTRKRHLGVSADMSHCRTSM